MFVWPPMPLQPLDDGPDRKLAHSDRLALPMMIAPAAFSCARDERVVGRALEECEGAGCRRHAGGVDVVLDDDRDPEQRTVVAVASRLVGCTCVGAGRRADRDHRVELLVELVDALDDRSSSAGRSSAGARSSAPGAPGSSSRRRRCRATLVFVGCRRAPLSAAAPDTPSKRASMVVRTRERRSRLLIA